jgi:hypothetical protein
MKKILAVTAAILVVHAYSGSTPALAADATPPVPIVDNPALSPADRAALKAAMAKLDASSAEIDKFLKQQDQATSVQVDPRFGSRPLRPCPKITASPTAEQAAALVQCTMDYETNQQAKLHQNITVQLGASRKPGTMDQWPSLDPRYPVVDIAGSATVYLCGPVLEAVMHNTGANCDRYQYQSAPGVCWKTLSGNYSCQINSPLSGVVRNQPPPTTY